MAVTVRCPNPDCGQAHQVVEAKLGRRGRCSKCGKPFAFEPVAATAKTQAARETQEDSNPTLSLDDPGVTQSQGVAELQADSQATPPASSGDSSGIGRLGRFEIRARLGSGAFGTVYRAHDPQLDREVALKVPHAARVTDPKSGNRFVKRFLNEAKAAARLQHPHIVPVFDAGNEGKRYYIASAFIEGETLDAALESQSLDFRDTARIVMQLAEALAYAHKQGIVHRDVKPANVMLDTAGEPHLMDFGLARLETSDEKLTQDGGVLGTPAYMSPEQARGDLDGVGPASDQYSLGVLLYELLCGQTPFSGPPEIVIFHVTQTEPPAPRVAKPAIPRDLETICLKAMAREPSGRYPTCAELAADLERFLQGAEIDARPLGTIERCWRWGRRYPARAGLLLASLVVIAALMAIGIGLAYQEQLKSANRQLAEANSKLKTTADSEARQRNQAETALQTARQERKKADEARRSADVQQQRAEEARITAELALREAEVAQAKAEELQAELEQLLSFRSITLAYREREDNNLVRADQILRNCPVEQRGWAWRYLYGLCHGETRTFAGHCGYTSTVDFSPDGKRIVTQGNASIGIKGPKWAILPHPRDEVFVWDAATGEKILTLNGQHGVSHLEFSPNGKLIAAAGSSRNIDGSRFGMIIVWDAETGGQMRLLTEGLSYRVSEVAFSKDSRRLAAVDAGGFIRVWNTEMWDEELSTTLGSVRIHSVDFSPNGKWLVTGCSDDSVRVWDAQTGEAVRTLTGHTGEVRHVQFRHDGLRILSTSADRTVRVWNQQTGEAILIIAASVGGAEFSPDGKEIVGGDRDGTIKVWDAGTGTEKVTLKGHTGSVSCVKFSPDGKQILSGSYDKTARLWDNRCPQRRLSGHKGFVACVACSPDGRWIASSAVDKTIIVRDAATGETAATLTGHTDAVREVAFDVDSSRILSRGRTLKFWEVGTWQESSSFADRSSFAYQPFISADGRWIFGTDRDNVFGLWNAETAQSVAQFDLDARIVSDVAISPDGTRLACAYDSKTDPQVTEVVLSNAASGKKLFTLISGERNVTNLMFTPDGQRIAVNAAGTVRMWDVHSGQETLSYTGVPARTGRSFEFSPDGRLLVAPSVDIDGPIAKGTLRVWDAQSGQEIVTFTSGAGPISAIAFTPDGQSLITGSQDGAVLLWEGQAAP